MPVVLQPSDSGFNSHLRDGRGGGRESEGAVPFVRLLLDKEVATLGMPHLKSLDLELQVQTRGQAFFFIPSSCLLCCASLSDPPVGPSSVMITQHLWSCATLIAHVV